MLILSVHFIQKKNPKISENGLENLLLDIWFNLVETHKHRIKKKVNHQLCMSTHDNMTDRQARNQMNNASMGIADMRIVTGITSTHEEQSKKNTLQIAYQ